MTDPFLPVLAKMIAEEILGHFEDEVFQDPGLRTEVSKRLIVALAEEVAE